MVFERIPGGRPDQGAGHRLSWERGRPARLMTRICDKTMRARRPRSQEAALRLRARRPRPQDAPSVGTHRSQETRIDHVHDRSGADVPGELDPWQ